MRTLVRWSNSSRKNTTLKPRQGEPSRRMVGMGYSLHFLVHFLVLEIAAVDRVEARLLERQPPQRPAGVDDGRGGRRADITVSQQPVPARASLIDSLDAGDIGECQSETLAVGLDLDIVTAAEHLTRQ